MAEEKNEGAPVEKKEEPKQAVQQEAESKNAKISKMTLQEVIEKIQHAQKDMGGGASRYIQHLKKRKEFLENISK